MFANSRQVDSRQDGVHGRLDAIVRRHLEHPFRRPVGERAQAQFAALAAALEYDGRPRVLDAGCGTGASTLGLARRHSDALVIGVDKSAHRLRTGQHALSAAGAPSNVLLLRCDVVDFWLLAAAAGWRFAVQYLLYPNPWPKPEHVQRRWPGHPVLPALLACGGRLELRTNWKTYADEWCLALQLANIPWHMDCVAEPQPISPFESKYGASAHLLWRVQADSALRPAVVG